MLEIIFSEEVLFDLPPPTLFFRANKNGYERLKAIIERMVDEGIELCLNEYEFIKIIGTAKRIIFKPQSNQLLLKITENTIITDISIDDWKDILDKIVVLIESECSSTYFIEFDNYYEEGNLVFES